MFMSRLSSYKWLATGLVGLNLVLGGALYCRLAGERTAYGQRGGAGDLLAVSGHSNGYGVIYVLNNREGVMKAYAFKTPEGPMNYMGMVNVQNDFAKAAK